MLDCGVKVVTGIIVINMLILRVILSVLQGKKFQLQH